MFVDTGWRVRSEVLPLTWDRVDFRAGVVRLDPNTAKTGAGRVFPFDALPNLASLLKARCDLTTDLERATGRIIPNVFHRSRSAYCNHEACRALATGRRVAPGDNRGTITDSVE